MTYLVTFSDGSTDLVQGDSAAHVRSISEADYGKKCRKVNIRLEEEEELEDDENGLEDEGEGDEDSD